MKVLHVVGARPNFMKVAPVVAALEQHTGVAQCLVHTGQHYDTNMSDIFFTQLGLPKPDINLEVGSGSHAVQTAQIMIKFEEVLIAEQPDWVLVYGDINSTVAAALVAAKLHVPVAHVEAGLRSGDRTMPEEINRLVTDQIADLLLTPSSDGDDNLLHEGIKRERIHCVGNVMIDTLVRLLPVAETLGMLDRLDIEPQQYGLITLHRPSNVDEPKMLSNLMRTLLTLSQDIPLVFPIHPRTRRRLEQLGLPMNNSRVMLTEPLGYLEFLGLQRHAKLIITDSGGIQEESTYLGVPCLTVRENTERPVTVTVGTNILVGQNMQRLCNETHAILGGKAKQGSIPPLWDGKASERIANILLR
jgi:UDP-N-acetylglucosamine 2-epimerase (non-hydrolysing)